MLALKIWRSAGNSARKFIFFTFAVSLIVPPTMLVLAHYHSAYRWMTYTPLAIAVPWFLETRHIRFPQWLVFFLISASIFLGVPACTLAAISSWRNRSMAHLEQVAAQIVRPNDIVVSNYKAYFVLRPRVKLWFGNDLPSIGEFDLTKNLPTNEIKLLCFHPPDSEFSSNTFHYAMSVIGRTWKKVSLDGIAGAEELSKTRYATEFYRRTETK